MTKQSNSGGNLSAPNRAPAAKVIAGALANNRVAAALIAALGSHSVASAVVATAASATTDFSSAKVGDIMIHVPASPGNVQAGAVVTAGTSPFTAVIGDLYIDLRAVNLDANNPLIPPAPAALTARQTGDGGLDF